MELVRKRTCVRGCRRFYFGLGLNGTARQEGKRVSGQSERMNERKSVCTFWKILNLFSSLPSILVRYVCVYVYYYYCLHTFAHPPHAPNLEPIPLTQFPSIHCHPFHDEVMAARHQKPLMCSKGMLLTPMMENKRGRRLCFI